MTTDGENPDRHTEPILADVDRILNSIQENYGLTRSQAIHCLQGMAYALEELGPGDPGLKERFYNYVGDSADCFEDWALKVGRDVIGWRDHA